MNRYQRAACKLSVLAMELGIEGWVEYTDDGRRGSYILWSGGAGRRLGHTVKFSRRHLKGLGIMSGLLGEDRPGLGRLPA